MAQRDNIDPTYLLSSYNFILIHKIIVVCLHPNNKLVVQLHSHGTNLTNYLIIFAYFYKVLK